MNKGHKDPGTEPQLAPETVAEAVPVPVPEPVAYTPPTPRQMRIERQGAQGVPFTRRFPQIRGGVCEFCGVLDGNVPAQFQYKLCPHYRGLQARCSYCPDHTDPDDVVYHEKLNVQESPDHPGTLIMWCGKYECSKKHLDRFQLSKS